MDNKEKTVSEKVLERIESSNVSPRSRTYFSLKNFGMWLLAGLSVLVGALAVSSILFRTVNIPLVLPPGPPPPFVEILFLMPFLWIALLVLFGYLAYREIRSTKRGYKYELSTLLLGVALISCVLGIVFYKTGTGLILDRFAAQHVPFQKNLEDLQRQRWMNPENGFLVGKVLSISDSNLLLADPNDTAWTVTFTQDVRAVVVAGERVGVRGEITDAEMHMFTACEIRSLEFAGRPPHPGERKPVEKRNSKCEDVRPLD